jgi:hypothetical protein
MKEKKQKLNLVNLKELTKGKKFKDLSEKKRLEICQKIIEQISPKDTRKMK